jgi:flavin-dependent dehydrogenase
MSRNSQGPPKTEVAVVGGSAAGLFAAHRLAERGLPVRVFEGAPEISPEDRTLIVTSRMRDILGPLEGSAVVNEIRQFELFTDGRSATVALKRPDLIVERSTLIKELAARASAAGAQVLLGRRFKDVVPDGDRLALSIEHTPGGGSETVHADVVIGADGVASRVARSAGWPKQPTVPLLQAIVKWPTNVPNDCVRVWFVPDETPYFFWLIPESPTLGALGLIGEDGSRVSGVLERFLQKQGLEAMEMQAARVPCYTEWIPIHKRLGKGDVYLVGDAGGHVKVTTVGGLVTGFRGAVGVADAILNGGANGEIRQLKRELNRHLLIRRVMHGFTQADYNQLIDLLDSSTKDVLGVYTRDEANQMLLRLCVRQPRLMLLAIRALLTKGRFRAPA